MQNLGYTKPLYILPFDHRAVFAKDFFNKNSIEELTTEEHSLITEYKKIIYEGFKSAVQQGVPKENAAILLDEQFGDEILKEAKNEGFITVLTIEKTGQTEFDFQYEDFKQHIENFNPLFTKVLIRYNPEDDNNLKSRQKEKLKIISDYSHEKNYKFLLEVLVIPNEKQKTETNNIREEFDKILRPKLTAEAIKELQNAGVEPDIWKLEGFESKEDYSQVIETIREGNRHEVSLVILGRGENEEKVEDWLTIGGNVEGVIGFAVGRTVFWQVLLDYKNGLKKKEEAINLIGERFLHFYKVFTSANP